MRILCATAAATVVWPLVQATPVSATSRVLKYDIHSARSFVVTAYSDQATVLSFPSGIQWTIAHEDAQSPVRPDFVPHSREVKLTPKQRGVGGDTALTVITEDERLLLLLRIVDRSKSEAYDRVEFYDGHAERLFIQEQCERRFKTAFAHLSFRGLKDTSIRHDPGESKNVELLDLRVVRLANTHQILFTIANHHHPVLGIKTIRVIDGERESEHAEFIEIDSSSNDPNLIAAIPKGKRAAVFIEVDDIEHLGSTAYLEIVNASGIAMETRTIYPFGDPYKKDPPNKGRLALQLQAFGGTISLQNVQNRDQSDFTTLLGVGGRAIYGFNQHLSIETSVEVLFTQQARFDDNSTSEATTMRTLLGGVVHFGDKIVPYLRGGLGIRLSDYTSSSAEDVGLKGSSLLRFGGGVDAWIGKNFTVGIAGHYVGAQGAGTDESFSIEGGIHAGYAWNP